MLTDNNPPIYLQTTVKLGATEIPWAAELAQFTFTIKYRSGRSNGNADALSRKASHGKEPPVARLEEVTSAPSYVLGNGTGTLIPGCFRACAEEAMAGSLL